MNPMALRCSDKDNVAVLFEENVTAGTDVDVRDKRGNTMVIKINEAIPYGHKLALAAIAKGEDIIKYGESIGIATRDIAPGDYVHIHNMDSKRGRGDWKE
ncbi:MAG: UxaA family hydrolase [Firmicutes bacterium]|nr:UxaA family hydrolase [Bacillota bacterium]